LGGLAGRVPDFLREEPLPLYPSPPLGLRRAERDTTTSPRSDGMKELMIDD
jgi:hypothetical protein